ncbi:MAG: DNA ligase [Alcanivorax sp.]|jgi:DNA ligase-1|nr:DNA ligase [Alcanivorax sp.]HIK73868.1 DNA ligase [Alcanivorax sp.]
MSRAIFLFVLATVLAFGVVVASVGHGRTVPALTQARVYQGEADLSRYWVSEKFDGVRAYWDGEDLISRHGNRFDVPAAFTRGFPEQPLDGELWMGRGTFSRMVGLINRHDTGPEHWRDVYYMVFDLPRASGPFDARLRTLRRLLKDHDNPHLRLVRQLKVPDRAALNRRLEKVIGAGGEGLMLHRGDAPYRSYRSTDLLKVKPYQDAEARVVAHLPGEGRLDGMMGALLMETEGGQHFRLGTGFSDAQRADPPPIGSLVTYKFYGRTRHGLPRFPSFLRVRQEGPGFIR